MDGCPPASDSIRAGIGLAAPEPTRRAAHEKGEIHTVRYEAVNAMLLNGFLKEHRKVEQQAATIARLKKQSIRCLHGSTPTIQKFKV